MNTNKTFVELIFVVILLTISSLDGRDVEVELNLDDLEDKITSYHDETIKVLPPEIRDHLLKCDSLSDLENLPEASRLWLYEKVSQLRDMEIATGFGELTGLIHGDDVSMILKETFLSRLKGHPINLEQRVRRSINYWVEHTPPDVKFAPEGNGNVEWIWILATNDRPSGALHIGLDVKSRRFVCYERTKGVYYPEGDTMERIRAEIVQDPVMAGNHVGKGYIESRKQLNEAE